MTTFAPGRNGPMVSTHSTRGLVPPASGYPVNALPTDPVERLRVVREMLLRGLVTNAQAEALLEIPAPHTERL